MENKVLSTGLTVLSFVIGIVGLIMGIVIAGGNEATIDAAITLSMVVMIACAGIALLFGLYFFVTNIKKNIPMLAGIVVFVIIGIIAYSMASGTVLSTYDEGVTESAVKFSDAGLMLMYVLVVVALVAAVGGEIIRIFK